MQFLKRIFKALSRKERRAFWVLLIIFLISGSADLWKNWTSIDQASEGIYSEGLVGEMIHLNPVFADFSPVDSDIVDLVFSGLVKYNAETGGFEEDMAVHSLSEDQLTYTFTLKENIYWHDGTPVTAQDIYYTYAEVIQSPDFKNPLLRANFEGIQVSILDSRTVSFTLPEPNSFFFSELTLGILPKHILGNVPVAQLETNEFNLQPIGSGPYMVDAPYEVHEDGTYSLELSAFPDYYGEKPKIQKIRFIAFPTLEDLVANRDLWYGAARIKQEAYEEMNLEGLSSYPYELAQYVALFFNTDQSPLDETLVRVGISKAINKQEIVDAIGYKTIIDTPLLELAQDDWIHQINIEEAQGALFDSGWKFKDSKYDEDEPFRQNEQGETLSLTLVRLDMSEVNPSQEAILDETAKIIQEQLREIGVEVIIISCPEEVFQQKILDRDYDMILYGQNLEHNFDTFAFWHSSQANTGLNLSNYQSLEADSLIKQIRETFDPELKAEYLKDLAQIISDDVPAVFLYTPTYYYLVDDNIGGITFKKLLIPSDRFSNISSWYFK